MNQRAIINRIAAKTGFYKKDVREMMLAFREVVEEAMEDEDRILLQGLLCIKPVTIPEKQYYNVWLKGLTIKPAHKVIKCFAGKNLRSLERIINLENTNTENSSEEETEAE